MLWRVRVGGACREIMRLEICCSNWNTGLYYKYSVSQKRTMNTISTMSVNKSEVVDCRWTLGLPGVRVGRLGALQLRHNIRRSLVITHLCRSSA